MLTLRYTWVWILLGWLLVAGVIIASVYPGVILTTIGYTWADKAVHASSYFLLMVWFAGLYARQHHLLVAISLLALGFVLEIIQWGLPYRFFEFSDVLANATGIVLGLVVSLWLLAGWCQRMESRLGYHD